MKILILLILLARIQIHGSFVDKIKTVQKNYCSITAFKKFYTLPLKEKTICIKNNPAKSLLYISGTASIIHTMCMTLDLSLAKKHSHEDNSLVNETVSERLLKLIALPFLLYSIPFKGIFCKFNHPWDTITHCQECSLSGHQYFLNPTYAYLYKIYQYFCKK